VRGTPQTPPPRELPPEPAPRVAYAGDIPTLDELGLKHGTDKGSNGHDYLQHYDELFSDFRHKQVRLLEVGVGGGGSLRMWRDYFPNAELILGFDTDPDALKSADYPIVVLMGDQYKDLDLTFRYGPFDIVLDDACHQPWAQILFMYTMWPHVKRGGYLIVEDMYPLVDPKGKRDGAWIVRKEG
jgi:hypothetical protein